MKEREVKFTVGADGSMQPAIPQYGGVKGEHCATCLVFYIPSVSQSSWYEAGDALRLVFSLGDGAVVSSDMLQDTLEQSGAQWKLSYPLPRTVTVPAGQLSVRLAVSRLDEETGEEMLMHSSAEAVLYFDDAAVENGTPFWRGVSEMLANTVTACETTRALRDETKLLLTTAPVFRYCGEASEAQLTGLSDRQIGDVYTVTDDGMLRVWTGQLWYRLSDHLITVNGNTLRII